ncbi:MAG: metallophosphoesterase family protein [Terriglobia bacterium]
MRIGLVSDTHGFFDERMEKALAGVEAILHAGDVGTESVLDRLALIAPTRAVRGNVDAVEMGLPASLSMEVEGNSLEMLHILPAPQAQLQAWACEGALSKLAARQRDRFLSSFAPASRIVLFGHSHQPGIYQLGRRLFINPGSAGKKRFSLPCCCGVMEMSGGIVEVKITSLEDYNEIMSSRLNPEGSPHVHTEKY